MADREEGAPGDAIESDPNAIQLREMGKTVGARVAEVLDQVPKDTEAGVVAIRGARAIWGKKGRWLVIALLALFMIAYELDNSTVYIYHNYATSSFQALSSLASLSTASAITTAAIKPFAAKLCNAIGRPQTLCLALGFFVLAYILMSASPDLETYATGVVFYAAGQSTANTVSDVIVSDITTARWRGFGIGVSFFPFLVTPWAAAFIVEAVVKPEGPGWRWGIGMFGFILPVAAAPIIATLLRYQRRAAAEGEIVQALVRNLVETRHPLRAPASSGTSPAAPQPPPPQPALKNCPLLTCIMTLCPKVDLGGILTCICTFCSQIDLGGILLLATSLSLLLLPLSLGTRSSPSPNAEPALPLPALISTATIGLLLLTTALPYYELKYATNPVLPPHYFKIRTVAICLPLITLDSIAFATTHTYLYAWAIAARDFTPRQATLFTYAAGGAQTFAGMAVGLLMAKWRRYKGLAIIGASVRLIGYGVMVRLRGAENPIGELVAAQLVQGLGSGIVQTTMLVAPQISVPHREMPQMTALVLLFAIMGSSIGACVAGGIYSGLLRKTMQGYLGGRVEVEVLDGLVESVTGVGMPNWGTGERDAVNHAFSDVLRVMTYTALGASVPGVVLALFLPNHELPDRNNLVEED